MSDRIKTILASGDAANLPEIARVLALDTDMSPEAAETVFAAARKDIASEDNVGQTITPPAVTGQTTGHQAQHGLGAAEVVGGVGKEAVQASWSKAVAHANRGFESLGA